MEQGMSSFNSSNSTAIDPNLQYVHGVFFSIISAFGLAGNLLSIVVLSQHKQRGSFVNVILRGLAFSDTFFLIACSLLYVIETQGPAVAFPIAVFLHGWSHFASVYITVAISVNRYLALAYPLQALARAWFTPKSAVWVNAGVWTGAALICTPHLLPAFGARSAAYDHYQTWVEVVFESIGPFAILIGLNIAIFVKFRGARAARRALTQAPTTTVAGAHRAHANEERQVSIMLYTVVAVFGVCSAPYVAWNFYEGCITFAEATLPKRPGLRLRLMQAAHTGLVINSSVNFLIYVVCCPEFRETLRELVARWLPGQYRNTNKTRVDHTRVGEKTTDLVSMGKSIDSLSC